MRNDPHTRCPTNRHGKESEHNKHKYCLCGGHNHNNPKKNLHNHSTLQKFLHRLSRKYWRDFEEEAVKDRSEF